MKKIRIMEGRKMGVTVSSENYSIDLGYGGFMNLRKKVAELTAEDIYEHYKKLEQGVFKFGEAKRIFFEKYDKKIMELSKKYEGKKDNILDFLYSSDCEAKMSVAACKDIYEVIKDYDDSICYGYCGREDCAMFRDFKDVVRDCIENNCEMTWY